MKNGTLKVNVKAITPLFTSELIHLTPRLKSNKSTIMHAPCGWKACGTFTIEWRSVISCVEIVELAWMEGFCCVSCRKHNDLFYHPGASCHRQCLKVSDCAGVSSRTPRLYPHLTTSAHSLGPAIPTGTWRKQCITGGETEDFFFIWRQWRSRLCAHSSRAHYLENSEGWRCTSNGISFRQ